MQPQVHERTPRPGRRRTGWLVGAITVVVLLAAVLWDGKLWVNFSTGLVDTRWRIETVAGASMRAGAFVPYLQFLPRTTTFGTDIFLGEDSCNSLEGTYAVTGDRVTFTHVITSLVGCSHGVDVIGALGKTRTWTRSWDTLSLHDENGAVTMVLRRDFTVGYDLRQPAPTPTGDPNAGPVVDPSRVAAESPSATSS